MVEVAAQVRCPACSTPLSGEGDSAGLCPGCLFELALDNTSLEAELLAEPGEAPTLQFAPDQTFAEGEIQGERYRIRSLLGRGGMGEVWRAYDLKLRQDVALKALRQDLIADQHALETLRQEVRVAREVISPNVCRVFDLQEMDGRELISMEYVDGTTLQEILKDRGPLELNEAREIASQFLAGLEAIHEAGLIHRDIKPENLMITRTGRVVVMDFGIAKGLGDGKSGMVAGTPGYMSPEQKRGSELDARADLYSAGIVLAEMVEPGGVQDFEARRQVWEGIHQDIPEVSDTPWSKVIAKSVSAETPNRYSSASELARALEEVTLRAAGDENARPYPGLSAFQQEDAEYFYGRELEVEALWKKLRRPHLLAVIGPSGAGKSSFLRAGLLPTLTDSWQAIIATPGSRPFANLARALAEQMPEERSVTDALLRFEEAEVAVDLISQWRQGSEHGLVILDQFEELFTQNPAEVQQSFAELLGALPLETDTHVLLSMRDDFLMHCHQFESLRPLFSELSPLDPPLGTSLRRALVQPALKCGYRFEDESIVQEMLSEVEGERGALPLLAFAAAQLWERRDRETGLLTRNTYEQIGGVGGALAQHAEAMLDYIGESNTPIVRELFRNLVTAQGTRAARDQEELLSVFSVAEGEPFLEPSEVRPIPAPKPQRPAAKHVLNSLIDARLLTSYEIPDGEEGNETHHRIEIVHESLLASWPRLLRWRTQDAQGAQLRDELRSQARLWDEHGRLEDYLWTGTAFKEYALWRETYPGGLTDTEEAFGAAMVHLAERRKRRRRIAVTVVIAALIVGLAIVGSFWRQAERETRRAEAGKLIALGEIEIDTHPTLALAWATTSLEVFDTMEARLLALRALHEGPPVTVFMDLDRELGGGGYQVIEFSPSGKWWAVSSMEKVRLHSLEGGEPIPIQSFPDSASTARLAFPSDEVLAVVKGEDVYLWSIPDGEETLHFVRDPGRLLSSHGDGFFTWSETEGTLTVRWQPYNGSESQLIGSMPMVYEFEIDTDGEWMVYSREGPIFLRSLENWSRAPRIVGEHAARVDWLAFHPEGDRVAASDESGEVKIWSLTDVSSRPVRTLQGTGVGSLSFNSTGQWLASAGLNDGLTTVRLWDLSAPVAAEPVTLTKTKDQFAGSRRFHPNRPFLASANVNSASFWPLPVDYPWVIPSPEGEGRVNELKFTPDGTWLLTISAGSTVRAWPLDGQNQGASRVLLDRPLRTFPQLVFHPSGEHFAVVSNEGSALLVPLEEGPVRELASPISGGHGALLAFSPDGRLLATVPGYGTSEEMVVRVWDLESAEVRALGQVSGSSIYLAFDDDRRLRWMGYSGNNTGGSGGERVFDLETGSVEVVSEESWEYARVLDRNGKFSLSIDEREGVLWKSFTGDEVRKITSHWGNLMSLAVGPSGEWVATGTQSGVVQVGRVSGEEPYFLYGHTGAIRDIALSHDGRWIASAGAENAIRLWPMPDPNQPPLHTVPQDELVAKLRSLTNVRVLEEPEFSIGWGVDWGPFPGWEKVPTWR